MDWIKPIPISLWKLWPTEWVLALLYTAPDYSLLYPNAWPLWTKVVVKVLYAVNRSTEINKDRISVWIVPNWDTPSHNNVLQNQIELEWEKDLVKKEIVLNIWDSIYVRSEIGLSTFHWYGEIHHHSEYEVNTRAKVTELKNKVVLWTATQAEINRLLHLTWWSIQTNTNNCNCP